MKIGDIVIYNNKKWEINSIHFSWVEPQQIKNFGGFVQVICNKKIKNTFVDLTCLNDNIECFQVNAEDCSIYLPEFL